MKTILKSYIITKQAKIFTVLLLTSILSFGNGLTSSKFATANPINPLPKTVNEVLKGNIKRNDLPMPVARAVLRTASRRLNVPTSRLKITEAQKQTWRDGCLELGGPAESCIQALVPGWRVVVSANGQTLVYHTDDSGSNIRLNEQASNIDGGDLPQSVRNVVLEAASQRLNVPTSRLKITEAQKRTWRDGCLELGGPAESCIQALVPGWRVVVSANGQTLVYHTDDSGSNIRLNEQASNINNGTNLPRSVRKAVLQAASRRLNVPTSQLRITKVEQITADGCLGLPRPDEACIEIAQRVWEVTVQAGKQTLVYRANQDGSQIRLKENGSGANLPQSLANAVLQDAAKRSQKPTSQLQIVDVERREWPDSCLGISEPLILCAPRIVPGWLVSVSNGQQRLVYRVGETNTIKFDQQASTIANNGNIKPTVIPTSELPPPLDSGMVFRQISSGGFTGRTYETVLLDDGTLIRVRIGDANDSERSVHRISLPQLRQFQKLLAEKGSNSFQNLSYPPPTGAADFITYTLTSLEGTVQFNDISRNQLPQDLQMVVQAWNQLVSKAQA